MADKYYRLVCFVVDICADVLREYFVKLAKTDTGYTYTSVDAYLSHRKQDVMQLFNNKKLRRDQYELLYPVNGTADENHWDVSILVTLISELFVTRLQPLVIVALKTEIRGIRNELQHHPNTGNISDDDFDIYWGRLDDSVRLIAKHALDPNDEASLLGKINQVKCNNLPNLSDCLSIWHEETSKQLLNIMNEVQANAEETTSILRQVTVQKPGPSGDKDKRIRVADDILARLQAGFESSMKDLSDDFNPPSEVTDIRAKLRDCHHVVVTGCNNSRYFETALAAIKGMDYNNKRCVEMLTSSDWRHIDPKDVDLVLCKDPFGGFSYDESKAKGMDDIFKSMMHSTKRDNGDKALDIVIVTDLNILQECKMHHDHELLDEMVKVFTDTSSTQPADLTIGCTSQSQSPSLSLLQNLKVMTSNFLKTNQISCGQVNKNVLRKAKDNIKAHKALVLSGPKNCEKTSVAVALTSSYESSRCLLLKKPNDVNYIDFASICLVIIDEFAGKYRYEENDVYEWYNMFDHLYNAVIAGQINVIITCEKCKLDKCFDAIGRHPILDHIVDVPVQTIVVKSEVTEHIGQEYGHVFGQIVTTDHSIGTISNITQSKNYTPQLSVVPSQWPMWLSSHNTIPVSTGNNSLQGLRLVSGRLVDTNHSIGTIPNTAQSKNYTTPLSVIPSQEPILLPISTENTSLQGRAQREGIQNSMQSKRGFYGVKRVLERVNLDQGFEQLPQFNPETPEVDTPLPQSPRGIIVRYKKRRKISSLAKSDDNDSSDHTSDTPKTPYRFDDDLVTNPLDNFSCPGHFSSLCRILDQRQNVVMQLFDENGLFPTARAIATCQARYYDIFPTKTCLQLKMKQVRQEMIAQSAAQSAAAIRQSAGDCENQSSNQEKR